ncbi:MAG: hypothetical protein E6248_00395 [Clostridium sp.]|uniref:hypothetical protein n=1 Tax=Clostridium sp. TaxID=1506 RepID=UPI002912E67A|nr:hypothetical protein [Clostridium sp.]MDU5108875.1 hypothetical protein [Clostridium sp.]
MKKARRTDNCQTKVAREYIRENYNLLRRNAIVENLLDKTRLKEDTIIGIYKEVELLNKVLEEDNEERKIKYKGREREFFMFNDKYLYKDLI